MLTLDEAYRRLLARAHVADAETVDLGDAVGRVLVEPKVIAAVDVPPFANSAMDGFAVRAADTPGRLRITGEVAAGARRASHGRAWNGGPDHDRGAAAAGRRRRRADRGGGGGRWSPYSIAEPVLSARHVRAAAHDAHAGDEICLDGALTPAKIAVLASLGIGDVSVRRKPVVAILSTGDELVGPGEPLGPGQIHDANTVALAAAVIEAGGEPLVLPRERDEQWPIERALMEAAASRRPRRHLRRRQRRAARLCAHRARTQWQPRLLAYRRAAGQAARGGGTRRRDRHRPSRQSGQRARHLRALRASLHPLDARPGRRWAAPRASAARDPDGEGRSRDARSCACRVWHEEGDIHARAAGGQASSQLRPMADANALLIVPEGQAAAETHLGYEAIVFEPMLLQSWR